MKHFLIFNTSYFGDTILTDPLCRNLKRMYPGCHTVFVANTPYVELARYMDGVDEVWELDKWGRHRGIAGIWPFYREHKGIYDFAAAFVIYGNERNIILSRLLGAKKVFSDSNHFYVRLLLDNGVIDYRNWVHEQDKHGYLAELYSKIPAESMKMVYHVPKEAFETAERLLAFCEGKPCIAINAMTKQKEKDLKPELVEELAVRITAEGYQPVMVGAGAGARAFYEGLPKSVQEQFINLIDKTTIPELGAVLKRMKTLISADTGTAHFALALGVPVVDVFYINDECNLKTWGPKELYPHRLIAQGGDFSAQHVWAEAKELIREATPKH
ncbi:MAG: glycosyltransferase family 9 protein [Dialister sp.]|nr:glycosyltransferase family 9 protein [Dialister sp.]